MMLLRRSRALCGAVLTFLLAALPLAAQDTTAPSTTSSPARSPGPSHSQSVLYGGLGLAETSDPTVSHAVPWTVGFTFQPASKEYYVGLDFAGEGTSLNNTSNQYNGIEQAISLNLIVGMSTLVGHQVQAGAGLLVGGRRVGLTCPDSYLGYQCYADQDPTPSYDINVGGLAHLTVGHLFVGARVTTVSRQGLLGYSF